MRREDEGRKPKRRWMNSIKADLGEMGLSLEAVSRENTRGSWRWFGNVRRKEG